MVSERLEQAIREALVDEQLPCAEAFRIAKEVKVSPAQVGEAANELGLRMARCQLGLFGYGPKAEGKHRIVEPLPEVPPELAEAIRAGLEDGRLPCARLWQIAKQQGRSKLEVSGAAEAMGVRVARCQLGCF